MAERRVAMAGVAAASVVSALVTWLGLLVAARLLGPAGYGSFMAVWSVVFAATGTLAGLQQEVTRRVAAPPAGDGTVVRAAHGTTAWSGSLLVGVLGAVLLAAGSPWWGPRVWGDGWAALVPLLAVGFVGYAWANGVTGSLAGQGAWHGYAATILAEGVVRTAVVVVVLLVTTSRVGWQLAILSGLLGWVALAAVSRRVRSTRHSRLGPHGSFLADACRAVVAAGCSGVSIAGFPALLLASSRGESAIALGVVVAVVVNARAPLLLLNSFQGPVIRWLAGGATLRPATLVGTLVVTGVAAAAGFTLGPEVLLVVFGDGFVTSGEFVAGVVLGVALTAAVTTTGWWALVRGRHTVYVAGWVTVVVTTVGSLALPLPLEQRTLAALLLPPLAGTAVHLAGVRFGGAGLRSGPVRAPSRS